MAGVIAWLNDWQAIWWRLMALGLVQSTLVFVCVAVAARLLRRASPALRYWLWQLVPLKLMTLPILGWSLALAWLPAEIPSPRPHEIPGSQAAKLATTEDVGARPTSTPVARFSGVRTPIEPALANPVAANRLSIQAIVETLSWREWLFVAWCAAVLLLIARLASQRVRLARLLRKCTEPDERMLDAVRLAGERLAMSKLPRVRITALPCSPFVCGMIRPTLVVPTGVADLLSDEQLRMVLAHELAHLVRRDLVWGWIGQIAAVLYFFHPVVHWTNARIRLERELACDQWAMAASSTRPSTYAEMLVRVAEAMGVTAPTPAAALGCDGGQGALPAIDRAIQREDGP